MREFSVRVHFDLRTFRCAYFRCAHFSICVHFDVRTFRCVYISICVLLDVRTFASPCSSPIHDAVLLAVQRPPATVPVHSVTNSHISSIHKPHKTTHSPRCTFGRCTGCLSHRLVISLSELPCTTLRLPSVHGSSLRALAHTPAFCRSRIRLRSWSFSHVPALPLPVVV